MPRIVVYQTESGNIYEINRPDGAQYDSPYYSNKIAEKDRKTLITTIDYETKVKREFQYDFKNQRHPESYVRDICMTRESYLHVKLNSEDSYFFDINYSNGEHNKIPIIETEVIRIILCFEDIGSVR